MREDRVDVLTSGIEAANQLVQEGTANMLVDLTDPAAVKEVYGYPYISVALISTDSYTSENPYITYRIVDALNTAIDTIKHTPRAESAHLLPAEFQSTSDTLSSQHLEDA